MNSKNGLVLLQLPVPPPAYFASTGNVPLASASLASAYDLFGRTKLPIYIFPPEFTDSCGDEKLVAAILEANPRILGLSLYLWNSERSLHIAKKVKEKSPEIIIVLGGPEVSPDNEFLLETGSWDYCFVGEAEDVFVEFLDLFLTNQNFLHLPALGFRKNGKIHFNPQKSVDFPLSKYPSPYLRNWIQVEPTRSTYIETIRGCRSKCTYCFYPKSSNTLRGYSLEECKKMFIELKEKGAKEFVFLDPTFNHRPNFEGLLDILIDINYDQQIRMFAEIRAEGMNSYLAKKLKKANFYKLEIGMQSINQETLKNVMRYGSPRKVAEISKMLVQEGIDLLLDLIIGLPGDSPSDVLNGIEFFKRHALEEYVQVFPLSVLPGTHMRLNAQNLGLKYLPTPPYRIQSTPSFSKEQITQTILEVEELLGTRIDEHPRPHLVEPTYIFNLDKNSLSIPRNLERHAALWFEGKELEKHKVNLFQFFQEIINKEPFITIDFVFYVEKILPIQFLIDVRKFLSQMKINYLKYNLSHRNEDMQHRVVLLLKQDAEFEYSILERVYNLCFFYQDMTLKKVFEFSKRIGFTYPNARIIDKEISFQDLKALSEIVDVEAISFANSNYEKYWTIQSLGYGDVN